MKNLFTLKTLHATLRDLCVLLWVALPIIWCVCLLFLIYTVETEFNLVAYYTFKGIALTAIVAGLCTVVTIGLGLYLKKRR